MMDQDCVVGTVVRVVAFLAPASGDDAPLDEELLIGHEGVITARSDSDTYVCPIYRVEMVAGGGWFFAEELEEVR